MIALTGESEQSVLKDALAAARAVRSEHLRTPRVDLFALAHSLGIRVDVMSLSGREAMYIRTPDSTRIILSSRLFVRDDLSVRGRFTLAHEIGHYFLDCVQSKLAYRPRVSEGVRERIADIVGSNIIIPRDLLREQIRLFQRDWSEGQWVEAWTIVEIKNCFGVSLPAVAHAVRELSPQTLVVKFDKTDRETGGAVDEYRVSWSSPLSPSGERVFPNQSLKRCIGLDTVAARRRSAVSSVIVRLRPLPVGHYWAATAIERRPGAPCVLSVCRGLLT